MILFVPELKPYNNLVKKCIVLSYLIILGSGVSACSRPRLSVPGAYFPAKIHTRWFSDIANEGRQSNKFQVVCPGSAVRLSLITCYLLKYLESRHW